MNSRTIKIKLKKSASFNHRYCDGRFCNIEDHIEMEAIRYIKQLEDRIKEYETKETLK